MNRKNGDKSTASGSTAHYSSQSAYESRTSHSGFQSFLKWFKKDERERSIRNVSNSKCNKNHHSNSRETFHSTPSVHQLQKHNGLSPSSSCDSIISTATTGFAFIPPNQYRPNGNASQPEILIESGPTTDTYRERLRAHQNAIENDKKLDLTLRKKYKIFDSDTVASADSIRVRLKDNKNAYYTDLSLPQPATSGQLNINSSAATNDTIYRISKPHRRTASDSSKDKKAGSYLHVKGKRKAPDPPPTSSKCDRESREGNIYRTSTNSGTLSPYSTLGRKKRKAPPPPILINTPPLVQSGNEDVSTTLSEGLLDDEEIKAIIQGTSSGFTAKLPEYTTMDKRKTLNNTTHREEGGTVQCTDTLKLEKGILRSNRDISNVLLIDNNNKLDERVSSISPSSISPRPWYKRSPSSNKDYAIPFKKEIVLRTMEKRKIKKSSKELESPQLPEVGFSRNSSLFEGLFAKNQSERSDDTEKWRRSGIGIGMPNISELDREAAEIVHKEQESLRVKKREEHEKYYETINETVHSKDNGASNSETKFIVNNAFIEKNQRRCVDLNGNESRGSKSIFINRMEQPSSSVIEIEGIFSDNVNKLQIKTVNDSNKKASTNALEQSENYVPRVKENNELVVHVKNVWICAYCTLENANWRVVCEVCERIRPPNKDKNTAGIPIIDTKKMFQSSDNVILKNTEKMTLKDNKSDWENKTDKVMKYFRPRISSNTLSKSASETSVGKTSSKKTTNKLLDSPKLIFRQKKLENKNSELNPDIIQSPLITRNTDGLISPLIDSSAVVTTITSVFYAPSYKGNELPKKQEGLNLEEVRLARLAKFSENSKPPSPPSNVKICEKSDCSSKSDSSSLEREKQRLREMIRVMNARALAEKYPVIQKSVSLDESQTTSHDNSVKATNEQQLIKPNTGAIKKIFNRKQYVEDKEISDNSNFAKNSKLDKEKLFLKLASGHKPDVLLIPTPIQELNEYDKTPLTAPNLNKPELLKVDKVTSITNDDKPDLVKIVQELNSSKGLESFKATLKNSAKQFNYTNTLALNKILKNLENAIFEGKHEAAAKLAMDLAKMKVSLTVTKQYQNEQNLDELVEPPKLQNVVVDMFVEDKTSRKGPIQLSIFPTISVLELKEKILKDFRIPIGLQRWILNDKLATDDKQCLTDFGMDDKSVIYLYIEHLKKSELILDQKISNVNDISMSIGNSNFEPNRGQQKSVCQEKDVENDVGAKALPLADDEIPGIGTLKVGWICPLCTLINSPNRPGCVACSESRPVSYVIPDEYKRKAEFELPEELKRFLNDEVLEDEKIETTQSKLELPSNDLNKINLINRKSAEILNISISDRDHNVCSIETSKSNQQTTSVVMTAFTSSPNITKNKYRGVDNYNPHVLKKAQKVPNISSGVFPKPVTISKLQESISGHTSLSLPVIEPMVRTQSCTGNSKSSSKHYTELLSLDTSDVVPNAEPFECPICFMEFGVNEGVVLRDCLHLFCRECVINTVKYSDEAEVKCPYLDEVYSCDSLLQEREIKSLVSKDVYEQHLAISLRVAENKMENAYHCKTPNCKGWCVFEDNVNEFKCPVCKIMNCLTCNVIHDGLNCKQYQDQMNSNCDSSADARRTKDMLAEMIEKGDAMNCPVCQVILMKKWGCDWLKCSMCKTEICWVTRGIRWGPEGKGDTSAGCKCGVNGIKCHPKCNYCH